MGKKQHHVHEFLGSVKLSEECDDRHNHRFAGVTGEAIPLGRNHIHQVCVNTDSFEHHYHQIAVETGPAIAVGEGKHVHFVETSTSVSDDHCHNLVFSTLIQGMLTPAEECDADVCKIEDQWD